MARHQLRPLRRVEPTCADFSDEAQVRAYEIAMRLHRAATEEFSVEPVGEPARDGTFLVQARSGGRYLVDLVSDGGEHDTCTCADWLGNQLGTCKHLGAVRRALSEVRALKRLRPVPAPRRATLTVDATGAALRLRTVGPRAAELQRRLGLDAQGLGLEHPERLGQGNSRVVPAVGPTLRRIEEAAARLRRSEAVKRAIDDGSLRLDVLREPLFPYQLRGAAHLVSGGRALLADDMGLGKTVQAIAAAEVMRLRGEVSRVLVVAPASLKAQWARELERYAGRSAVVIEGGPGRRRELLSAGAPWTIANYEQMWHDPDLAAIVGADLVILDEAQRAKNFRTRTASLLRSIASPHLFVLTGTPVENRLDDLYSLLQLVDPTVLGPLWRFNLDFHVQTSRSRRTSYRNLGELRTRIAPLVVRRRKEEVLSQLPPLTAQTRYVPLSDKQAKLERTLRREAVELMAVAQRRPLTPREQKTVQSLLLKARQACNAAQLCDRTITDDGCAKLDELEQLVGEVVEQGGAKLLVFSEWTEMLRMASQRLDAMGVGHSVLHGGVPTAKRAGLLANFREDPTLRVLLSTDAGGVGLNLQAASYVIHLDLPWNPGRLDQRTARAHRLGQTRGVSVIHLCAQAGIERGIEGTLAGKRAVRSAALDPGSEIDVVEAPSFTVFVRELQDALALVDGDGEAEPAGSAPAVAAEEVAALAAAGAAELEEEARVEKETREQEESTEESPAPVASALGDGDQVAASTAQPARAEAPADPHRRRASDRLRLAEVVLAAGFGSDAARAAYDALASALRSQLPAPVGPEHGALVAAAYRELVPSGRAPDGLLSSLARLRDLTLLEAEGVSIDAALASAAVEEARGWVARLAA